MSEEVYRKLANVLDTLPNGFPTTEEGVEIALLKKIFDPDEADLFCDLRLTFETPEQIAERTGRPLEGLAEKLKAMRMKGQLFGIDFGTAQVYRMLPWVFGIYEFQLKRMDREMAELSEAYMPAFGPQFFETRPQLMQVLPVEKEIGKNQEALNYEKVSSIIETGQSFAVNECICKKEKHLLDHGCDKPLEVCMAIAPVPGVFENDNAWSGRVIDRKEAYAILDKAEAAGLVHLTSNITDGRYYICNCCGCCCGVLRAITEYGINGAVNAHYYAEIDAETCESCGICADERCQIQSITEDDGAYRVLTEKCIGCGLCISTCPADAIRLVRKEAGQCMEPPSDEAEWFRVRGANRGVDFSEYA